MDHSRERTQLVAAAVFGAENLLKYMEVAYAMTADTM